MVRASDAAPQLMQLREAELVRAVDDDRVRGGHVDAGLDDRRANEEVHALLVEVAHDLLELALRHLAVRHRDARFGKKLRDRLRAGGDRVHLVVQEIDLAAALQLAQRRLAHDARRVRSHERLDRKPPLRRGGDDGKVANALERHRERARNRRGRQREHVDFRPQALQELLLPHAEAVLLVDDDEPQVLELDVALQQLVRADDEVDLAARKPFQRDLRLLRRAEARKLRDAHGKVGEAIGERLEVLLGEEGRGHEQSHLLAVREGDERGAQRDLGLAETDVAADESIHRLAATSCP